MDKTVSPKVSAVHKAYAGAHYGKSLFWYMSELLFGYFLAEVYQIEPSTLGTLLFAFLIWDAITDPLIAVFLWRRAASTKTLLQYQAVGAVICSMMFVLVFAKPSLSTGWLTVYALAIGFAFRAAYTIFDVPQNALLQRLSITDNQRVYLSSARAALSALATLTLSLATIVLIENGPFSASEAAYFWTAAIFALIAIATAGALLLVGWEFSDDLPHAAQQAGPQLRRTLSDPQLLRLYIAGFFLSLGWPLFGKLIPFFSNYSLSVEGSTGILIATIAIANLVSQPAWTAIAQNLGRNATITTFLFSVLASSVSFWTLGTIGLGFAIIATAALAASTSAIGMIAWANFADELSLTDDTNDVFAFGLFTFFAKVALGFGGLILGWSLDWVGYRPGEPFDAGQKTLLSTVMVAAPAFCSVAAGLLMMRRERPQS